MAALQRSTLAFRRVLATAQRRGLAADHGPTVTWAEYRSGEKSLTQWVDGNREKVSLGFFVFYCSLAAWALRPKKGKGIVKGEENPVEAVSEKVSEAVPEAVSEALPSTDSTASSS